MSDAPERAGAVVARSAPSLVFAAGPTDGIAAILEAAGDVPLLTTELAVNLSAELRETADAAARMAADKARVLTRAAACLGERHDQFTAQTVISLLVFDGLVSPVVRRLAFGDARLASVIAVRMGGSRDPASIAFGGTGTPFRRACVRPADHDAAAVFCCDDDLPISADLHATFSNGNVRRAISTVNDDESIAVDELAMRLLNRIGAVDRRIAFGTYSAVAKLPKATPEALTALRDDALKLARSLLLSVGAPQRLTESLLTAGTRVLTAFTPQALLEATLGIFYHCVAHVWYEEGVWLCPPPYRLLNPDGRAMKSLIQWSLDA